MESNKVFVYGTLMTVMPNHSIVLPYLKSKQAGKTRGLLYDLPFGYPAVIKGPGTVLGEVFELENIAAALEVLYRLEGFVGEGCDNYYDRVVQEVQTTSGEWMQAYIYLWANPEKLQEFGTLLPQGDWRNKLS